MRWVDRPVTILMPVVDCFGDWATPERRQRAYYLRGGTIAYRYTEQQDVFSSTTMNPLIVPGFSSVLQNPTRSYKRTTVTVTATSKARPVEVRVPDIRELPRSTKQCILANVSASRCGPTPPMGLSVILRSSLDLSCSSQSWKNLRYGLDNLDGGTRDGRFAASLL